MPATLAERISKGNACVDNADDAEPYLPIKIKVGHDRICSLPQDDAPVPDFNSMQHANARLIVEAFNVTNTTGKTPGQLVEALKEINDLIFGPVGAPCGSPAYFKIREICCAIVYPKNS